MNSNKSNVTTLLFNPFVYVAGARALLIGWAAILLAGFFGMFSQTHFDGVLDIHIGSTAPPWWFFLSEGIINWICLCATLLIAGRLTSRTSFRTIDLAGTQALARWPTIFAGLIALPAGYRRFGNWFANYLLESIPRSDTPGQPPSPPPVTGFVAGDAVIFAVVTLGTILLLCWMVFLMYKAYAVSCNLSGPRAVLSFIVALIAAEIVSKVALYWLYKYA